MLTSPPRATRTDF